MHVNKFLSSLVSVLVVFVIVESTDETCNRVAQYMHYRGESYSQSYAAEPAEPLNVCNSGPTCCNHKVEVIFTKELDESFKRMNFLKDAYVTQLEEGRSKMVTYMTQMLTVARSVNSRTNVLVEEFLESSDKELLGIDKLPYPQSVLVDIAESYGVTELLWEDQSCIREMMDYLVNLGEMQVSGLTLARLLYRAIPEGVKVLTEMHDQTLSDHCLKESVRAHRCNFCKDSTAIKVRTCFDLCMVVASQCYSHLAEVSDTWEQFANLTERVMDSLDKFSKIYEQGLERTIRHITTKLNDHDTADMCGYNVASNLARHKRSEERSQIREKLFNGDFMVGMLGDMHATHCRRFSSPSEKCWNGTAVGPLNGESDIDLLNDANVTEGLSTALLSLAEFNKEFKAVSSIKLEEIYKEMDSYNLVTDQPDFVKDDKSSASDKTLTLAAAIVSFLLLFRH